MYSRGLRYRPDTLANHLNAWKCSRARALRFSHLPRGLYREATNEGEKPKQDGNGNRGQRGHYNGPQRGSIRPFTVLLLCIPLGYGLNWALNGQDGTRASTGADGFVKYKIVSKEEISSTCSIFALRPASSSTIRTDNAAHKRAITSVQFKQPQLQIARNYTVLPPVEGQDPKELRFLIRKERNGEVSGWLHKLPVESQIELRGLSAEYVLPEKVDSVIFLAGGTGIAPAIQVADALGDESRIHILWANRKKEDSLGGKSDNSSPQGWGLDFSGWWSPFGLPSSDISKSTTSSGKENAIVSRINSLKQGSSSAGSGDGGLLVDYFVDDEGTFVRPKEVARLLKSEDKLTTRNEEGRKLLFVSGPEGFVNHWAGPKRWVNGIEVQGPLGGVLSTLDLSGWEVVKL